MSKSKILMVNLNDIIVQDRGRQKFTRIEQMAESIKKLGVIHPLVVSPSEEEEGKYYLVAGERRYRGAFMAGVAEVPCTLREDSEDILKEIEYEENVCRQDLEPEEEGIMLKMIVEARKKQGPGKGTIADISSITQRSAGDISRKINFAEKLKARPELREQVKALPMHAAVRKIEQIEQAEKVQRLQASGKIKLSSEVKHGSCINLIKELEEDSVDLVVTDPPYGINKLEDIKDHRGSKKFTGHQLMSDTHNQNLEKVEALLTTLGPELARVLKPGAHFYCFCPFQYVDHFVRWLSPLEFQPPVLVWRRNKPSAPAMGYNYMSCVETIIYGYNPPRKRRLQADMYNVLDCPDVPRDLRRYPTEKPVPLLKTLIEQSSFTGEVVLDPFAGSGSTLVAARQLGRTGIGFEIDQTAFLRIQDRLLSDDEVIKKES